MKNKFKLLAFVFFTIFLIGNISALTSISNCTELQDMNLNLAENYQLINNIDCSIASKLIIGSNTVNSAPQIKFQFSKCLNSLLGSKVFLALHGKMPF